MLKLVRRRQRSWGQPLVSRPLVCPLISNYSEFESANGCVVNEHTRSSGTHLTTRPDVFAFTVSIPLLNSTHLSLYPRSIRCFNYSAERAAILSVVLAIAFLSVCPSHAGIESKRIIIIIIIIITMFYYAMAATQNIPNTIYDHKYTLKTQLKHIKGGNKQKRTRKYKKTRSIYTIQLFPIQHVFIVCWLTWIDE